MFKRRQSNGYMTHCLCYWFLIYGPTGRLTRRGTILLGFHFQDEAVAPFLATKQPASVALYPQYQDKGRIALGLQGI